MRNRVYGNIPKEAFSSSWKSDKNMGVVSQPVWSITPEGRITAVGEYQVWLLRGVVTIKLPLGEAGAIAGIGEKEGFSVVAPT